MFFCFQLAEILHKTVDEIMEMSTLEMEGWCAYFEIKAQRMNK
tara:strand:- start:155 stop:283 length:129 start_codon:yes stop_codon:yes gene_type:complete